MKASEALVTIDACETGQKVVSSGRSLLIGAENCRMTTRPGCRRISLLRSPVGGTMSYPGRAVRSGDSRSEVVKRVQERLNAVGCGPLARDGIFAALTESSVKLFQTRRGLLADGIVGPMTWNELFQETPIVVDQAPTPLLTATLEVARSQDGVREDPGRPNRGVQVDQYVRSVGLDPNGAYSWCQAFVYWCFSQAAATLAANNPCI